MKVKIYIEEPFNQVRMIFYEDTPNGRYVVKPMKMIMEKCEEEYSEPSLAINREYANEFLQAMAEALDAKGIKTDKDAKIQGTLEATKYHLEDMRKLLKII